MSQNQQRDQNLENNDLPWREDAWDGPDAWGAS